MQNNAGSRKMQNNAGSPAAQKLAHAVPHATTMASRPIHRRRRVSTSVSGAKASDSTSWLLVISTDLVLHILVN